MAGSPEFKVYRGKEYIAACKFASDAAAIVGAGGEGTVRYGHRKADILWTEGAEEFSAAESWDGAAQIMLRRLSELSDREYDRVYGQGAAARARAKGAA